MHIAANAELVNPHVNLNDELSSEDVVRTVAEIEKRIKKAEPKVDMIFLEAASLADTDVKDPLTKHIG